MKRFLSLLTLTFLMVAGCNKYDDSDLQRRVSALEAFQSLLQKLDTGKPVTSYSQSGTDVTFNFSDGTSITIDNKPSADNPIKAITADGNTLTITLADGSVIPVVYGEKEEYTFTLGDGVRKCYSFWETEESYNSGVLKIPYTLTGDLQSVDDVTIVANVTPFAEEYIPLKDFYSIEKVDAKSGYLVVNRLHENAKWRSDEEITMHFPGGILDLTANFPDGSIRTYSIKVLSEAISIYAWDTCFDLDYTAPVTFGDQFSYFTAPMTLTKDAGYLELWCYEFLSDYDFEDYDGAPLNEGSYEDRIMMTIAVSTVDGMKITTNPRVQEIGDWKYDSHKKHYRAHSLYMLYQTNYSGQPLYAQLGFYFGNVSLYNIRLIQPK